VTQRKINVFALLIFLIAAINVVSHLVFSANLEYNRDELLYFSLGSHPAFGYATVPPLIGWIAMIMQKIFGHSLFAVRLFPALLSGVMVYLVSATVKELGGSWYARILAATGLVISIFGLRTYILFQPVHIDLFFWSLFFYLVIRYVNTMSDRYLVLIGITAGFALLNKYLIGLLFLLFLLIVPFTRHRHILSNRKFWYGMLFALVIFLPNIIWQLINGLPVIHHMSELERTQLVHVDKSGFLLMQVMSPGMASFLTIGGLIFLCTDKSMSKFRFIGIVTIAVVLVLMFLKGKSYYTQGIYPVLIAAGAVSWERLLKKKWAVVMMTVLLFVLTIPMIPIGIPVFSKPKLVEYFKVLTTEYGMGGICSFEDTSIHSLPQDYADMVGWRELAAVVGKAWKMIPDKKSAAIYCENYGQAGAVTIIGKEYGLPDALCFSESFRYWLPDHFDPDLRTLVYINDEPGDDIKKFFQKITKVGGITDPDSREFGTSVYLCEDPVASFNKFWIERVKSIRAGN
jgi:hypothetical protein